MIYHMTRVNCFRWSSVLSCPSPHWLWSWRSAGRLAPRLNLLYWRVSGVMCSPRLTKCCPVGSWEKISHFSWPLVASWIFQLGCLSSERVRFLSWSKINVYFELVTNINKSVSGGSEVICNDVWAVLKLWGVNVVQVVKPGWIITVRSRQSLHFLQLSVWAIIEIFHVTRAKWDTCDVWYTCSLNT